MNYPVAIDRTVGKDTRSFGATFEAYGVRAIPTAAVVDRRGGIAFIGGFEGALVRAAGRLEGPKK